jgi:RimJ/RimL family protein N-acetyltransferase
MEVQVSPLALEETGGLAGGLSGLAFGPLRLWPGGAALEYWLNEIRSTLSGSNGSAFVARAQGRMVGLALLADLGWDTRVVGRRMTLIRSLAARPELAERAAILERLLDSVLRHAQTRGVECLVHRPFTDDAPAIHALERRGFLLMDTLLDYVYDFTREKELPRPAAPPGVQVRAAGATDLEELLEVARRAFAGHCGRFHADPHIPRQAAVRVYEEWIRSSLEGFADWVFAAEVGGAIAGYSVWKRPSEAEARHGIALGHYSIGAVAPAYSGRGLFRALTLEGMRRLSGEVSLVEGPTHVANLPVQRAYASLGWRIAGARHGFHRWLDR